MTKFILKRALSTIVSLFLLATLTFFMMHAIPGGPFTSDRKLPPEIELKMKEKYHLNEPVFVQYKSYLQGLIKLDLGPSIKYENMSVNELISEGFPPSFTLGVFAVALMLLLGIPLGVLSAIKRGGIMENLVLFFSTIGVSVPSFVLATLLMYVFSYKLRLLPMYGITDPNGYILPAVSLAGLSIASITRLTRSSLLDVLNQDYIITAKAKGLSNFKILFVHALKNSLIPIVTVLAPTIASLITGTFVIEKIFAIPGMGKHFVNAIANRDYTVIMGVTLFYAVILNVMVLLADMLYVLIDPRIRLDK